MTLTRPVQRVAPQAYVPIRQGVANQFNFGGVLKDTLIPDLHAYRCLDNKVGDGER